MQVVGHFELLEKLGAGGMGEVYRARDQRLHRYVALKFLAEAAGGQARDRFEREAQIIAALNHPHICTLYEAGQQDGRPYLVLELLEGESLKARLARGPVEPPQLFDWASQIADALDAAHRHGVLHRDLKPDNIFVLPSGHLKVLDFGLARKEGEVGPEDLTLTSPGIMLGTIPYMSPEQARGEYLDARSDIFSFGSVFYEMASGKAAFAAQSAAETLAAVLHQQPPPAARVRTGLPAKVDEIAGRCLEKDPELRYQSAADLRSELKRQSRITTGAVATESGVGTPASTMGEALTVLAPAEVIFAAPAETVAAAAPARHWRRGATVAAVVVLAAAAGWWRYGRTPAPAPAPHLQFRQLTFSGEVVDAVISPDGKFVAHADLGRQGTSLHLFSVSSGSDVEIVPAADGCCQSPTFSPDGGAVYYLEKGGLYTVPVLGGAAHLIAPQACSGAGVSPDGSQIAYLTGKSGENVMLAKADGTDARVLQRGIGGGYESQCWTTTVGAPSHSPVWSPDGRWIAAAWAPAAGSGHVMLINPQTGQARPLGPEVLPSTGDVNWLPDGSGLIMTASLPDNATSQVWEMSYPGGKLRQLTDDLQGYTASSLSSTGQLALVHAVPQDSIWVQQKPGGGFVQLPGGGNNEAGVQAVVWNHKGGLTDIRLLGGKPEIWEENSDGSGARPITSSKLPHLSYGLLLAPNGQMVFGDAELDSRIWRINGDGTGLTKLMPLPAGQSVYDPSLVLGGTAVSYLLAPANGDESLWVVGLDGSHPHRVWSGGISAGTNPGSPDGNRVFAISTGPEYKGEAVIIRVDGKQPQVTPVAGFDRAGMGLPWTWTPDGKGLTYVHSVGNTDNLWVLPLDGGAPHQLTHFQDLGINHYDYGRDGRLAISRGTNNADVVVASGLKVR